MVKVILITHGSLGDSLIETAQKICPFCMGNVISISVSGKVDLEELTSKIKTELRPEGTLILADSFGGTSCNIAIKATQNTGNTHVLCGVNLNMILAALNNQAKMNLEELTQKVLTDGKKAVLDATEILKK